MITRALAAAALAGATALATAPATASPGGDGGGGTGSAAVSRVVIAPHGSNSAAGTAAHPMRTVRAALRRLGSSGGTVLLRGGVYHQRIHLMHEHHITVRPYRHEHATLSGAGLVAPQDLTALVEIANSSDITVRGLELTDYRSTKLNHVPAGVYVHGHDVRVRILDNHVHDLGNYNNTLGSFDINAHGIAAYGDDPHGAIRRLLIAGNTVDDLHLGASESVVVNGNVKHWAIVGNRIHDNDNIGIDAIGFEPTLSGKYRYTHLNRARYGLIAHNIVRRIYSQGNPAYWEGGSWCNCADGVYVDGGMHIHIRDNRVADSDIGIEVAAENGRGNANHVVTAHNKITGSLYTGITTGGYCNGAKACGDVKTGSSFDNVFRDNWLRDNNRDEDGSPELLVQYYAWGNVFTHNTLIATNASHVLYGTVPHGHPVPGKPGNRSDHNVFRARGAGPAHMQFGWLGHTYTGARAYERATGQDRHSTFR